MVHGQGRGGASELQGTPLQAGAVPTGEAWRPPPSGLSQTHLLPPWATGPAEAGESLVYGTDGCLQYTQEP